MTVRSQPEMTGPEFARILRRSHPHYPVSDAYEHDYLPGKHWWTSQQEHVTTWLDELAGPGAYGRVTRGLGARHGYTHLQCAPGLLWIAEAVGEDPKVVVDAAEAAGGVGRVGTQCAAIRRLIPWLRVEELARRGR